MDLISLLATLILVTTVGTLVVAVAAYFAFKLRDKRKPVKKARDVAMGEDDEPIFLKRYRPENLVKLEAALAKAEADGVPERDKRRSSAAKI